ncbi:MAG: bifunctional methylenetetrahydrofolate dehydrogenase/methenyltetrahydrofolate cyclohydrolase FolD [Clostridia bacterium]
MTLLNGTELSKKIRVDIKEYTDSLTQKPELAVILVGSDPASQVYVRNKKLACEQCGIVNHEFIMPEDTTMEQLLAKVHELNENPSVNGILVQSPLPKHLDENEIIKNIAPEKDVDAFHNINVGKIMTGDFDFLPCTPSGIMSLLAENNIEIDGKNAVVIGRSNIVGKPMAMLMLHKNATVTICHSRTKNLAEITKNADIIIVAIGKARFLTADMVSEGAVVIDVGMNRVDGKLCGDVDFDNVAEKCSYITPVPGGVGPMTITTLMQNAIKGYKIQNNIE